MSQSERLVLATRYRLISEIGRGANGTVWRGHDDLLDRSVAVKELQLSEDLTESERVIFFRRTLREARAPAQLRTPSIVEVYDVVIEQSRPWIVMELIEAPNLEELIQRDGPLPPERVAHIGRNLLEALAVAHKAGIVHRDLKPSNVLLDGDRVVLTDFGLAYSSNSASITKTGHFMGSPAYVAPEVAAGETATPQSDLWSLGATLYAAVEGTPPFDRGNVMATLSALANEDPDPPRNAGPLSSLITGLLRKNPTRRLTHERAVDRLERAMAPPRSVRRRLSARHRFMVTIALVAATVASCAVGTGALIVGMVRNDDPPAAQETTEQTVPTPAPGSPEGAGQHMLVVRGVTGNCSLFVSGEGNLNVLYQGPLTQGDVRQFDDRKLSVVINDASACQVWIKGAEQPLGEAGERKNYRVE